MTLHAMHCKAEKPHLSLHKGWWSCFFKGRVSWGERPRQAYEYWYMAHAKVTGTRRP